MVASSLANWLCLTSATVWSAAKFAKKKNQEDLLTFGRDDFTAVDTNGRKVWTNFKLIQLIHTLYNCTRTMSIGHPTMHYFGNSRCPSSMIAYIMILTEYSWIIASWECCLTCLMNVFHYLRPHLSNNLRVVLILESPPAKGQRCSCGCAHLLKSAGGSEKPFTVCVFMSPPWCALRLSISAWVLP